MLFFLLPSLVHNETAPIPFCVDGCIVDPSLGFPGSSIVVNGYKSLAFCAIVVHFHLSPSFSMSFRARKKKGAHFRSFVIFFQNVLYKCFCVSVQEQVAQRGEERKQENLDCGALREKRIEKKLICGNKKKRKKRVRNKGPHPNDAQ